jgi:hypothetical protein
MRLVNFEQFKAFIQPTIPLFRGESGAVSEPANDNHRHGDVPDREMREILLAAERITFAEEGCRVLAQFGKLMESETIKP